MKNVIIKPDLKNIHVTADHFTQITQFCCKLNSFNLPLHYQLQVSAHVQVLQELCHCTVLRSPMNCSQIWYFLYRNLRPNRSNSFWSPKKSYYHLRGSDWARVSWQSGLSNRNRSHWGLRLARHLQASQHPCLHNTRLKTQNLKDKTQNQEHNSFKGVFFWTLVATFSLRFWEKPFRQIMLVSKSLSGSGEPACVYLHLSCNKIGNIESITTTSLLPFGFNACS